tara:strand:+ start:59 stop:976 length:918 start_codon:yes stop_codon:yes gene_type:complete
MNDLNGFLVINKNKGCTSHDCVKKIRRILNRKKVGHTGTLDPEVTGVLPIAIGNATRFIQYLPQIKTYFGIIQLGIRTNTDDIHGEIINKRNWPTLSFEELNQYLDNFRGLIKQVPPKVSSVHINGERAYKKSFRHEEFELPIREVNIFDLTLKQWDQKKGLIHINVKCSSGTYIRSLARDLGSAIGTEGCLFQLERTQASGFKQEQSITIDELNKQGDNINTCIIPIIKTLNHIPSFVINDENDRYLWETGRKIRFHSDFTFNKNTLSKTIIKVIDNKNKLLGIGLLEKRDISYVQPKLVLNAK